MTLVTVIVGLVAAFLLLAAGWLLGVRRGHASREQLRHLIFEQSRELQQAKDDFAQRSQQQERNLKATIEQALAPLVQREQLSIDLSQLKSGSGERRDLTLLLDQIADVGNFSTVVICDDEGLPLAANDKGQDVDRHAANSSLILLLADRMTNSGQATPMSIMVHDESNVTTLCRFFRAQDQRLSLTAVTSGARLGPTALDPALVKVTGMLTPTA